MQRSTKYIISTIAILVGLLAVVFTVMYLDRVGKYPVTITVAPKTAQVTIGGVAASGTTYLAPGSYEYVASLEHFHEERGTLVIADTKPEYSLIIPLSPSDDEGQKISEQRTLDYQNLEGIAGENANKAGEQLRQKYPVIEKLPHHGQLFSIGYKTDPNGSSEDAIIITIHASPVYWDAAVQQLSSWGVNPAEYKLEFVGEENPFK